MEFKFRGWMTELLDRFEPRPQPRIRLRNLDAPAAYPAVSVRAGYVSCEAAKQFGNKRFLSNRAPRLPLPECTCENCECSYVHYADRRSGFDRRKEIGKAPVAGVLERRLNPRGRRATDASGFDDPTTSF